MDLFPFFKAVLDQDKMPVVICAPDHTILYVNPTAAARYARAGGADLVGQSLLDCHSAKTGEIIKRIYAWFEENAQNNCVFEGSNPKENKDVYMIALRDEQGNLIGYYEKHEPRTPETDPQFFPQNA